MKTFVAIEALGLSVAQRKAAKDWAAKFCEQKIRRFPFRHGGTPKSSKSRMTKLIETTMVTWRFPF